MINFRDNYFFVKFVVLFFILTIFGYWGIDLNSEELYIAFSFFLLVVAGLAVFRRGVLLVFIESTNVKYFRLLSGLIVTIGALNLSVAYFKNLKLALDSLSRLVVAFVKFSTNFLIDDFGVICKIFHVKSALVRSFLPLGVKMWLINLAKIKKLKSFKGVASKFFSIKIK